MRALGDAAPILQRHILRLAMNVDPEAMDAARYLAQAAGRRDLLGRDATAVAARAGCAGVRWSARRWPARPEISTSKIGGILMRT